MNLQENSDEEDVTIRISPEERNPGCFIITWVCLYLISFPFVLLMSLWSLLIFSSSDINLAAGFLFVMAYLSVPFSMLISIWKMWSMYIRGNLERIRFFCALPLLTFLFLLLFDFLFRLLLMR